MKFLASIPYLTGHILQRGGRGTTHRVGLASIPYLTGHILQRDRPTGMPLGAQGLQSPTSRGTYCNLGMVAVAATTVRLQSPTSRGTYCNCNAEGDLVDLDQASIPYLTGHILQRGAGAGLQRGHQRLQSPTSRGTYCNVARRPGYAPVGAELQSPTSRGTYCNFTHRSPQVSSDRRLQSPTSRGTYCNTPPCSTARLPGCSASIPYLTGHILQPPFSDRQG